MTRFFLFLLLLPFIAFGSGGGSFGGGSSGTSYTTFSFLAVNPDHAYVDCGNNLRLERTDPFSFTAWINPTVTSATYVIIGKQASDASGYVFFVENGHLFFEEYAAGGSSNALQVHAGTISPNTWYHVAATTDGTFRAAGTHLYINGVDQTLTVDFNNLSASILNSTSMTIGGNPSFHEGFSGLVTNLGVYNVALNQAQITAGYNGGQTIDLNSLSISNSALTHFYRLGNGDSATTSNGFLDSKGSLNCTGAGDTINASNIITASPDSNTNGNVNTQTVSAQSYLPNGPGAYYLSVDKAQGAIHEYNSTFGCLYWGGITSADCIFTWQAGGGFPLATLRGGFYPFDGDDTGHVGTIASDHYGLGRFNYGAFTTLYSWGNKNAAAQTTLTGDAGTAVCSQPEQGSSYKKVVCYLSGYSTTSQAYTFPVAFSHAGYIYGLTGGVAVSSASTTQLTFTSATTLTGFVFVEGY